ncbi:MAG: hypothetical protein Kow00117_23090 [Phototrophicales bacterium]
MLQLNQTQQNIIYDYSYVYKLVYGQEPTTDYVGNQWYKVNGEMVHHRMLLDQIEHLRDLARRKQQRNCNRSAIRRLIDKLKLL